MNSMPLAVGRLFQSTRPRGARRSAVRFPRSAGYVSIHAPAWGATWKRAAIPPGAEGFNPRARVGRDMTGTVGPRSERRVSIHAPAWGATLDFSPSGIALFLFQSTRPRGARPRCAGCRRARSRCFNPRARVGRDVHQHHHRQRDRRFQSTRPRGARLVADNTPAMTAGVSIHAPAWGATGADRMLDLFHAGFNPRARVGRDRAPRA